MQRITKVVSLFPGIMMFVSMTPLSVFAAGLESRTLTIINNVNFKLVGESDLLPFQYTVTLNGKLYTGKYDLINSDGSSAGEAQISVDGIITLKPAQKAVIDVNLGDSYTVEKKQFVSNKSYDGNYYAVIYSDSKSGMVEIATYYYCTQNGIKSQITEDEYNAATNNGAVTELEGYVSGSDLVSYAPYVVNATGETINYERLVGYNIRFRYCNKLYK